jgi:hypothetical protein
VNDLRALTLHQPWASLVAVGAKTIETRSWAAPEWMIGERLLIHAGKRRPDWRAMKELIADREDVWNAWYAAGLVNADGSLDCIPLGAVVASCRLAGCVPMVADYEDVASAYHGPAALEITSNGTLLLYPEWDSALYDEQVCDVTDQRPFGHFEPGRYAWLLEEIEPTMKRCPRCWGTGVGFVVEHAGYAIEGNCSTCADEDGEPSGRCAPVPMRGRQGLWKVKPEDWGKHERRIERDVRRAGRQVWRSGADAIRARRVVDQQSGVADQ